METNGSHWLIAGAMAFWAALCIAIMKGVKAVLSHVWVSRDEVQKEYDARQTQLLDSLHGDIMALTGKVDKQGAELACLKGVVTSQGRMLRAMTEGHDGR